MKYSYKEQLTMNFFSRDFLRRVFVGRKVNCSDINQFGTRKMNKNFE